MIQKSFILKLKSCPHTTRFCVTDLVSFPATMAKALGCWHCTFAGHVEARLVKTPLHLPSLMVLRSISGMVLVVLVEVRGEEETMGRRRGHQSASARRSLQHQRGASGGCGLVQSRGGCGLRSMLCSMCSCYSASVALVCN